MELRLCQKGEFVLSFGLGDFGVADLPLKSCANIIIRIRSSLHIYHEYRTKTVPFLGLRRILVWLQSITDDRVRLIKSDKFQFLILASY